MTSERESEIRLITYALREYWLKYPEWRLGQLLMNVSRDASGRTLHEGAIWERRDKTWQEDFYADNS